MSRLRSLRGRGRVVQGVKPALNPLHHVRDGRVAKGEDPTEVLTVDAVQLVDGQLPDVAVGPADAGVVDQHVDPAPCVDRPIHGAVRRRLIADVADLQPGVDAAGGKLAGRLLPDKKDSKTPSIGLGILAIIVLVGLAALWLSDVQSPL